MAGHYQNTVENQVTGKPVNGATILVYVDGATIAADGNSVTSGTLATIYSDDGVTAIVQASAPLTTGSDGEFDFYTSETRVVIEISYDGEGRAVWNDTDILGGSVSSDVTALAVRVSVVEIVTTDPTVAAFKALTGAADKVPYFTGTDTMALADFTAAGRAIVDDASATAQRATLGLGTSAVIDTGTSGTKVALTDGANTWSGAQTDSALATFSAGANLTPATTPATNAVGYLGSPVSAALDSGDATIAQSDNGKTFYHTDGNTRTLTIPANASVPLPVGAMIGGVNESGAGVLTIAITTDTLRWASSTGSRTIAANGAFSLQKVAATVWRLTGDGIT